MYHRIYGFSTKNVHICVTVANVFSNGTFEAKLRFECAGGPKLRSQGAQGAQARAWRQRCVGAPAQPIPFLRAASAREARVWSSLPPSQLESPRRELWSCFSRRRAAPHDGPRFRATTMLYTAPPGAARFPGLFGDFYGMHFFVSLVLTARGSSD